MHGGAPVKQASEPDAARLRAGLAHLEKHLENARTYGLPPIVAINVFPQDTADELDIVQEAADKYGARVARSEGFARGGDGAIVLAKNVCEVADATDMQPPPARYAYELYEDPREKVRKIARTVYGAKDVVFTSHAEANLRRVKELGYADLPICMAKTQLSLTDDPTQPGRPRDFVITVREVRLSAGAGFLVPLTGEMMTMPGLPKVPAARSIKLLPDGRIKGLMQND
jgi:formate--tetrahydrofolate ligase